MMIQVLLELDEQKRLLFFEAAGHAYCGLKGHDIVCAAVTALLRTTVQALAAVQSKVAAEQRGILSFTVLHYAESQTARLQYAAEFLWLGLSSLQREYPQAIQCKKTER